MKQMEAIEVNSHVYYSANLKEKSPSNENGQWLKNGCRQKVPLIGELHGESHGDLIVRQPK